MLTFSTGTAIRDCGGSSRRDFLRAGTLALGGLSLPWLLRARAESVAAPDFIRDKAVVLVFLAGGASHIETFNPNMDGPEQSRSITGEVQTDLPGVTLGGTFPKLARHAKNMAIVRNFRHPVGNHDQAIRHVLTGGTDPAGIGSDGFGMGSIFARLRGANHPETGLPTYALAAAAPHADPQYNREAGRVLNGSAPGTLGTAFAPFVPPAEDKKKSTGSSPARDNLSLQVPADRLGDRRELLRQLDGLKRGIDTRDAAAGYDQFERQAADLLTGKAGEAFDLSKEDRKTRDRYDTSAYKVGKKIFEPSSLGSQFLLARRLIEAGCGFVTVQSAGWDMHADGNNPPVEAGMKMLGGPLDHALATFLDDLAERGLSDKVLTIVTGDFGRTPKVNKNGGRDHWANLCTLALFGGGLNMGQVVGRSARDNSVPADEPVGPQNLLSTVLHTLFDAGKLRVAKGLPANLVRLAEVHKPIEALH